jgi:hypothetical protein
MTENTNQVKHSAEPARGDRLRACLIEMLAFGLGALAVFRYKPEGILAEFIVFVGAYTIASSLLHVLFLAALGQLLLTMLTPAIHLYTLAIVPVGTSGTGLVFTFLLPGIAQAYWLWELWPATGALSHPLTVMCTAWLAVLGIWILGWRAPHSLRHHRVQMKPLPEIKREH